MLYLSQHTILILSDSMLEFLHLAIYVALHTRRLETEVWSHSTEVLTLVLLSCIVLNPTMSKSCFHSYIYI